MFPVPTLRLAAITALASFVVLFLPVHRPLGLVIVDGLILVVAAADAFLAPDPGAIGIEREAPGMLTLGAEGDVRWRLRNPSGRRLHVAIADELAPSLHASTRRLGLALPPGAAVTARATITPARRGRFEPSEIVVRVDGPLGLASRQRARQAPATIRVLPLFRSRAEAELRVERARLLEIGLRTAQGRGGGTEFDSLREYGVDDELRRIDWAATARSGRTIVRTYRAERNQQVVVLLDNGRMMAGQVEGVPRVEWAMDAAMTLTAVATRLGDRCGLVAFDRDVRAIVPPSHSAGQLARVTEAMYDLEPRLVESDYRGAFAATLARFRRRALLVLITELAEEALSETLVPALPLLLSRHLVMIASVLDPDVVRWANAIPEGANGAYREAAALGALERRGQVAARLRGLGATVIDAPPSALAGRLADAYLQVKATGRL